MTDGIEGFRFNTAVARCYELVNAIAKTRDAKEPGLIWARGEALLPMEMMPGADLDD